MAKQRHAAGDLLGGRSGYLHGCSVKEKKELMNMYHVHTRNLTWCLGEELYVTCLALGLVLGLVEFASVIKKAKAARCVWPGRSGYP
jgi:hypothetical protein